VEYAKDIHNVALEDEIVLPRAYVLPMNSGTIRIPAMAIGDHSSSLYGGFIGTWKGETSALTEANPTVRQMELNANKLTGFIRYSNELFEDMPAVGERQLKQICGRGLGWYRDAAYISGTGAGQPLGLINNSCKIEVSAEAGQAAASIVYENLTNMLSRLYPGGYKNAVWICHTSTVPSLLELSQSVGTGGSAVKVMTEDGSGKFRMLGLDVVFSEKGSVLGTAGDIILADLTTYVCGVSEELRIDTSQHVYFASDEGAMRLISRIDGQSLWSEALTLKDGSTTVSPIITLETR
jgi:HK97 family phage major capsid protein